MTRRVGQDDEVVGGQNIEATLPPLPCSLGKPL